jgi:hypothetical protein
MRDERIGLNMPQLRSSNVLILTQYYRHVAATRLKTINSILILHTILFFAVWF